MLPASPFTLKTVIMESIALSIAFVGMLAYNLGVKHVEPEKDNSGDHFIAFITWIFLIISVLP